MWVTGGWVMWSSVEVEAFFRGGFRLFQVGLEFV